MNTLKHTHHSFTWFALLAVTSGSLGASQAFAADAADDTRSEKVSYADLNLSTPEGAATLYNRISSSARKVCGSDDSPGRHFAWKECRRSAIAAAVSTVNSPLLTALHEGKTGGPRYAGLQSPRSRTE